MARKPLKMKKSRTGLLNCERHLLLTGECVPPSGDWRDQGEPWTRPFILVSPAGRDEMLRLWSEHRDPLLLEWKKSGKKGLPWAEKIATGGCFHEL